MNIKWANCVFLTLFFAVCSQAAEINLAPNSFFVNRTPQNIEEIYINPQLPTSYDPNFDIDLYEQQQSKFIATVEELATKNTDVTVTYREKGIGPELELTGTLSNYTNYYTRTVSIMTEEGEKDVLVSDLLSLKIGLSENSTKDLSKENVLTSVEGHIASNLEFYAPERMQDYKPLVETIIQENIQEMAEILAPLRNSFTITRVDYIGEGSIKKVFRVEAQLEDGTTKIFGLRLITGHSNLRSSLFVKGAELEKEMFSKIRELNGVGISLKAIFKTDDMPIDTQINLLNKTVYAVTIGDFADGISVNKTEGPNRKTAYKDTIRTLMRGWLLTFGKASEITGLQSNVYSGISIGDIKGENFVQTTHKAFEAQEPVLFIDMGDVQPFSFEEIVDGIRKILLKSELGLESGSSEEAEYLSVIYDYIASFIDEKGYSLLNEDQRHYLINTAKNFLADFPQITEWKNTQIITSKYSLKAA